MPGHDDLGKRMKEFYNNNADFRDYVNSYCKKHKTSVEEALQHAIVKEYAKYKKDIMEGRA